VVSIRNEHDSKVLFWVYTVPLSHSINTSSQKTANIKWKISLEFKVVNQIEQYGS